ncbi:MAG: nucleoside monophosphate kinase [bacterium]
MKSQTIIFIGRSGCGKGTQADLVEAYLKANDPEKREIFHIVTGNFLRELAKETSYTAGIIRDVLAKGTLVPDFLPVSMWGKFFMDNIKGHEHIITDGMPRKLHEAIMLDGAFRFYKRDKPIVIFIDLSYDSAVNRLMKRKRADDTKEAIEERLKFYDADVTPVIDYYRNSPEHVFLHIDGEPDIETIGKNIMSLLKEIL